MSKFLSKIAVIFPQSRRHILRHSYQAPRPRQVILLRHGESCWDKDKIFEGWHDSGLTEFGKLQSFCAGNILRKEARVDCVFVSALNRAQESLEIVLDEMKQCPDVVTDWRLNERHFGELTGFEEKEMMKAAGKRQVKKWMTDYNISPPAISEDHPYYCDIAENFEDVEDVPDAESICATKNRVLRFWNDKAVLKLRQGKRILIVAHDVSLKAIIQHLEHVKNERIANFKVPVCVPIEYRLDNALRNISNFSPKFWGELRDVENIAQNWGKTCEC